MLARLHALSRRTPLWLKRSLVGAAVLLAAFDLLAFGCMSAALDRLRSCNTNYKYSQLPGRPASRPAIAIITYYSPDAFGSDLRKLIWSNKQQYAAFRGYDVHDISALPVVADRIAGQKDRMHNFFYYKYAAALAMLNGEAGGRHYDYVLWSDPDALFLNYSKRLEDIIDERFDVLVTTAPPDHPQWGLIVNTGAFIVKNSAFGRAFLEDVLEMSQRHCGEFLLENPAAGSPVNGWLQVCNADGGYWLSDQGIVQALLSFAKPEYRCHIKKTWFRAFNSEFPWFGEGDLAVHFPGRSLDDKKRLIKAFLKFTDTGTGRVHRRAGDLLKSDESLTADLTVLEAQFAPHNPVCT